MEKELFPGKPLRDLLELFIRFHWSKQSSIVAVLPINDFPTFARCEDAANFGARTPVFDMYLLSG